VPSRVSVPLKASAQMVDAGDLTDFLYQRD
jgi:hypothetical protein